MRTIKLMAFWMAFAFAALLLAGPAIIVAALSGRDFNAEANALSGFTDSEDGAQ